MWSISDDNENCRPDRNPQTPPQTHFLGSLDRPGYYRGYFDLATLLALCHRCHSDAFYAEDPPRYPAFPLQLLKFPTPVQRGVVLLELDGQQSYRGLEYYTFSHVF